MPTPRPSRARVQSLPANPGLGPSPPAPRTPVPARGAMDALASGSFFSSDPAGGQPGTGMLQRRSLDAGLLASPATDER